MPSIVVKVARAARRADDSPVSLAGRASPIYSGYDFQWYELLENLDSGLTNDAAVLPVVYSASAGAWRRLRTADSYGGTAKCPRIRDAVGLYYGLIGEYLLGSPRYFGSGESANIEALSHGAPWHIGKLDGALTSGGSATFSLYTNASGTWTDTTTNLTVYASPLLSSGSIATGKWVRIGYELTYSRWEVISAEC